MFKSVYDSQLAKGEDSENKSFSVLSSPEFLAEGTAINDLLYPDRVLIGGENTISIDALTNIYSRWVKKEKILHTKSL